MLCFRVTKCADGGYVEAIATRALYCETAIDCGFRGVAADDTSGETSEIDSNVQWFKVTVAWFEPRKKRVGGKPAVNR
jgi:hypothetical protein